MSWDNTALPQICRGLRRCAALRLFRQVLYRMFNALGDSLVLRLGRCGSFMCVSPANWTCSECGRQFCFFHTTTHGHKQRIVPEQEMAVSA